MAATCKPSLFAESQQRPVRADSKTVLVHLHAKLMPRLQLGFKTKAFLQLMDRLMELLGGTVGATVLHQMGIEIGRSMFGYLKDEMKSESD